MKANEKINILIIDDDPTFRNLLRNVLREDANPFAVDSPSMGFKILKSESIDIVICDYQLPEMNGLKVLEKIKEKHPGIEVIMISSTSDMNVPIGALRAGAADYFKKPFTAGEIWVAIERTRRLSKLNKELSSEKKKNKTLSQEVKRELGLDIIGNSAAVKNIRQQIEMVAKTPDTSVLIIGESGTGKELVARGIHQHSSRKNELFGAVNMSAVPETLFESEFFGHKKGSFTGAISDKAGWFESANKGTLFMDEIGEMPLSMQVKLLRVLEDRNFTKVGTQKDQGFDVRIVSATNKTVEELTNNQHFRLDLFHRLGTFIIEVPPLRERKDDIEELTNFFLQNAANKMGKYIEDIHPKALDLLLGYSFPGNIRELRNLIERAVILCPGKILETSQFSTLFLANNNAGEAANENNFDTFDLKEIERRVILKALQKVNYNKAEASRLLNIEWNALHRRIQKYGIDLP